MYENIYNSNDNDDNDDDDDDNNNADRVMITIIITIIFLMTKNDNDNGNIKDNANDLVPLPWLWIRYVGTRFLKHISEHTGCTCVVSKRNMISDNISMLLSTVGLKDSMINKSFIRSDIHEFFACGHSSRP